MLAPYTPPPFIRKRTVPAAPAARNTTLTSGQSLALAGIAHDARNLVTALKLCADLIAEPGVLAEPHSHFIGEVQSIADAAGHLTRRLASISRTATLAHDCPVAEPPIHDLAAAVRELSGLVSAVAGPAIETQLACLPCAGTLRLTEENLTRILLNLVRNAADAMPNGGRIRITVQRGQGKSFLWTLPAAADDSCSDLWDDNPPAGNVESALDSVVLCVEDNGPGISADLIERVFDPGFSTRREGQPWPLAAHHGLGLSIVRQLVETAGGTVRAVAPPNRGTRFEIELPVTNVTEYLLSEPTLAAKSATR
jgi:two-component system cell cycle sensor histidine kinase/response regulator CckA